MQVHCSKVLLHKWLLANHLICSGKKGISSHQLTRMLGVTYKTAWFVSHLGDTRGGLGANFVVHWVANHSISDPVVETVMAGSVGTRGISFVTPAQEIRTFSR